VWAWGVGGMFAHQILNGTNFTRVVLPHSVVLRADIDDDDELWLLGRTEAYVVLWMPNRSRVLIIADADVHAMQIEPLAGQARSSTNVQGRAGKGKPRQSRPGSSLADGRR
jgi:hypothetical protein